MHREQLKGKLARLLDELRTHGSDAQSVHAKRIREEIAATQVELQNLSGPPIADRDEWNDKSGASNSPWPGA